MHNGTLGRPGESSRTGALVPLDPPPGRGGPVPRPLAAFVTQVLACRAGAPAYRARRRLDPGEASSRYGGEIRSATGARLVDRSL